jgi:hypothetical protein
VAPRRTPEELFELVLRVYREHHVSAGRPLALGTIADAFRGETAFELEIAIGYGIDQRLLERVSGKGYLLALTRQGERRMRQRPTDRGQGGIPE